MTSPTTDPLRGHAISEIPASQLDLVQCPPVAALTTVSRDGSPQTSVVWCDYDGGFVRVNTMRGFAKERNMRRDPRVTLLCYDPRRLARYLEVRGIVVDLIEDGARKHLDDIASRYAGRRVSYFGDVIPARFAETEIPVLCRIAPTCVVVGQGPIALSGAEPRPKRSPTTPTGSLSECRVPPSHVDLLSGATCGVLTTMGDTGQPHSSLVSVAYDGDAAFVTTSRERQPDRDLRVDARVALLVVDPDNTSRYVQLRGDAVVVPADAVPAEAGACTSAGTRVTWQIHARRVICDAIHA
ncbi:TIGR03618 family F420-dependent PPOX class oxidoreductase [Monashia sp. NPDC004114]